MSTKPTRREKKKKFLKNSLDPQPFSAATFSSSSQQFSAALLSTAILCSHFQQPLSAALLRTAILSSFSQHSHSQQPLSAALLSSHYQQIFSAASLSRHFQQPLTAAILSYHLAVVRGWWSAIRSSSYCGQLLWSGVGGQLLSHHVAVVRGWWSTIVTSCCYGQGLVVMRHKGLLVHAIDDKTRHQSKVSIHVLDLTRDNDVDVLLDMATHANIGSVGHRRRRGNALCQREWR